MLAVSIFIGGGSLFSGLNTIHAADVDKTEVIKKVAAGKALSDDEKKWFNAFFGGSTLKVNQQALEFRGPDSKENGGYVFNGPYTVTLQSYNDGSIVLGQTNYGTGKVSAYVFGSHNEYSSEANIHGFNNTAFGNYSTAIGYQNRSLGNTAITMGQQNIAGPMYDFEKGVASAGSGAMAFGVYAFANGGSSAFGSFASSLGNNSTAIGSAAVAGKKEVLDYLGNVWLWHNNQPYYSELQKMAPDLFGTYTDETKYDSNRFEEARTKIFALYKDYFASVGINNLDQLKELNHGTTVDPVLQALGFQYLLTKDNIESPVAIGTAAHALADNTLAVGASSEALVKGSVGLGAFSRATESDMVADGTKAPFSEIVLSTGGTPVNGINEYLIGPVAIGGKQAGNESAIYLRQLKYLADGTDDTDAVNLRQLKEAVKNSGNSGGGDNNGGGNTGSSIVYEAGDNITITDGKNDHTKVINATGITEMKEKMNTLNERVDGMTGRISRLDDRVDKVGAGAAALAALHPLDYDPDDKLDVAAGYGHYAGASAVALGAYYRPNEDVMFSIGGSFGNGEEMMNAGVSLKVGSGKSGVTTSKAAMARRIQELEMNNAAQQERLAIQDEKLARQDQKLANQNERLAKQETEIQELKEMIKKLAK